MLSLGGALTGRFGRHRATVNGLSLLLGSEGGATPVVPRHLPDPRSSGRLLPTRDTGLVLLLARPGWRSGASRALQQKPVSASWFCRICGGEGRRCRLIGRRRSRTARLACGCGVEVVDRREPERVRNDRQLLGRCVVFDQHEMLRRRLLLHLYLQVQHVDRTVLIADCRYRTP